jgi:hypothetical protein
MIVFGTGRCRASPGDEDVEYVLDAISYKQARERYCEQFGVKVDDRKIDAEIEKAFKQWRSYEDPPWNVEIPVDLVLAILLRKGGAGSGPGPKPQPTGLRLKRDFRALVRARLRVRQGEKLDDVAKDTAKRCSLDARQIQNRLRHPGRYGLKKYDDGAV